MAVQGEKFLARALEMSNCCFCQPIYIRVIIKQLQRKVMSASAGAEVPPG